MRWASTVVEDARLESAIENAVDDIRQQLGRPQVDLAAVFVSRHFAEDYGRIPKLVLEHLDAAVLVGCSAGGVIGGGREIEQRPAVSLTAARLPGVKLKGFHLPAGKLPPEDADVRLWEQWLGLGGFSEPLFLVLADPYSADAERMLRQFDHAYPQSLKVGGLASSGGAPGENALYLDQQTYRSGIVGLALSGNIAADAIVAQGCRPIGEPMFVTKAHDHLLLGLDGQPPVAMLSALYERLSPDDQALFRHSLFVGVGMPGAREQYRPGDFLIRNLAGMDPDSGTLAVGARLVEGMVVQFHLRDATASAADLKALLRRYRAQPQAASAAGGFLFSCVGRGIHLYKTADHDSRMIKENLGDVPLGGFFCNGEIGPVQGATYLHGYTSSFALFRPRQGG